MFCVLFPAYLFYELWWLRSFFGRNLIKKLWGFQFPRGNQLPSGALFGSLFNTLALLSPHRNVHFLRLLQGAYVNSYLHHFKFKRIEAIFLKKKLPLQKRINVKECCICVFFELQPETRKIKRIKVQYFPEIYCVTMQNVGT